MTDHAAGPLPTGGGERRRLLWALSLRFLGLGFWAPLQVLYFTGVVGLPTQVVAAGLTLGILAGLGVGIVVGRVADVVGAQRTAVGVFLFSGVAAAAMLLVDSVTSFLLVALAVGVGKGGQGAVQGALVADVATTDKVTFRARAYALQNLVMVVGGALSAVVLHLDTRAAFSGAILVEVVACWGAAGWVMTLSNRRRPRVPRDDPPVANALRDGSFMAVSGLAGVLVVFDALFTVLLPLWIVQRTDAPTWVVSVLFVLACVVVVAFQERVARRSDDPRVGARRMRTSAWFAVAALGVVVLTAHTTGAVTIVLLVVGAVGLTCAEMWFAVGEFSLSFGLAPEDQHGQYQGAFAVGVGLGSAAAPSLVTALCLGLAPWGWVALAGMLLGAGQSFPRVTRRAAERAAGSDPG